MAEPPPPPDPAPAVELHVRGVQGTIERDALIEAIQEATAGTEMTVQAFDPGAVYGRDHLDAAARRAVRAHAQGHGIANDLGVEMALYAAGTTQITEAFERVGVPAQGQAAVLAAIGAGGDKVLDALQETLALSRDDALLEGDEGVLDRLGIPADHRQGTPRERWGWLVLERVALLDAIK